MKYLISTLVAALTLSACADSKLSKGQIAETLAEAGIIGGTAVEFEDEHADYVVMIRGKYEDDSSFVCTGTVIDKDIVLTAAHCIGKKNTMQIIFGADPVKAGATNIIKAADAIPHEDYNKNTQTRNDIALIKLEKDIPVYSEIAQLPWSETKKIATVQSREKLKAFGFGITSGIVKNKKTDGKTAGVLRQVQLIVNDLSEDQDSFSAFQTNGKGICSGDSGGPVFRGTKTTVGITSYAITDDPEHFELADNDVCNFKSVFTNVLHYKDWILKGIRALHSQK